MPGSGPIDPETVVQAIQAAGTTWSSNHLVLDGGANKWPTVDTSANRWTLSSAPACLIDQDTFNALRSCTLRGAYVLSGGLRYELAPVPLQGSTWATLLPA